jgi:hypothetical protein
VPAHQSSTFTGEGGLTLTRFIVEAAAGERIPFQRGGHHGWLPAKQWQQYLEANGPALDNKERQPSVRQGERHDRCTEDRPASGVRAEPKQRRGSRVIVLESAPGKPRPPGFRSTRQAKRSRFAASAAVSPQAFQAPKGCPSTSRAAGSMRDDLSATADRPSLRHLVPESPAQFGWEVSCFQPTCQSAVPQWAQHTQHPLPEEPTVAQNTTFRTSAKQDTPADRCGVPQPGLPRTPGLRRLG